MFDPRDPRSYAAYRLATRKRRMHVRRPMSSGAAILWLVGLATAAFVVIAIGIINVYYWINP